MRGRAQLTVHKPRPKAAPVEPIANLIPPAFTPEPVKPEPATKCSRCGGPLVKGAFSSACRTCSPFDFQPCGICGTARVHCCC